MFCSNCGKELPDNAEICTNCGAIPKVPVESNVDNFSNNINGQDSILNDISNPSTHLNSTNEFQLNKPLSTATFFFTKLLFLIPIINLIFILIWSFKKNTNLNLKSYSRAMLIWYIIASLFFIFILLTMAFVQQPISSNSWLNMLKNL